MGCERHFCDCCGEELFDRGTVMLMLSVYGQYRAEREANQGLVHRKKFRNWLRKVGPLDDEQLTRVFFFLKELRFVSNSKDREYLIYGVGEEAEQTHQQLLWRNKVKEVVGQKE